MTKLPQAFTVFCTEMEDSVQRDDGTLFFLDKVSAEAYMKTQNDLKVADYAKNKKTPSYYIRYDAGEMTDVTPELIQRIQRRASGADGQEKRAYVLLEKKELSQLKIDLAKYKEFDALQSASTTTPQRRF